MTDCLIDKRSDGVAIVTLNRPERMNALSQDMTDSLGDYLDDCEQDPGVRCIAVTGAGRAFCAGGDIQGMHQRANDREAQGAALDFVENLETRIHALRLRQDRTVLRLHTIRKPTVAVVNGYAVGAGLSVAMACDVRLTAENARFSTGFANMAASGDNGGTFFLSRLVGGGLARELMFDAGLFDARRAREIGLVNHVYPESTFLEESLAFCAKLAAGPTAAYGRMKANLNRAWTSTAKEALDDEAVLMCISGMSNDQKEAVRAFVEKRQPVFHGR